MGRNSRRSRRRIVAVVFTSLLAAVPRLGAQTDYYNTDRGRPIQIEDAYATERYAFELKLAPVRLERIVGGAYRWGVEPEVAFGLLPRTHLELGVPLSYSDNGGRGKFGIGGLELTLFHNLNAETTGLPALGLRADLLAPVGNLAAEGWYTSFTGIATRTFRWARFHVNGQYTVGDTPTAASATGTVEAARWLAGMAMDKTFPLQATLVTVEAFARKPLTRGKTDVEFTTGAGARYQLTPTLALDGGAGRRLNGDEQGWYVTFGTAYAFGLRSFLPGGR